MKPPVYREVTLRLPGALPNTHEKLQDDLRLYLGRFADGAWRSWVLGYSAFVNPKDLRPRDYRIYNWIDDEGTLTEAREQDKQILLTVNMTIHPDLWVAGGKLEARIRLRRGEDGKLDGTYEGTFRRDKDSAAGPAGTFPIEGAVRGSIAPEPWPAPVKGHRPLKPGEHPRLLFRQDDVQALRERMDTPVGKEILRRLEAKLAEKDAAEDSWRGYGYGLMYQLTGKEGWARKGLSFCDAVIASNLQSPRYGWATRDGGYMRVGPSAAAVAVTYDLCYHGWAEADRKRIAAKLEERIWPDMAIAPKRSQTDPQFNPRSNHYLLWNGGAGMVALAILGDAGVAPENVLRAHRIFQQRLKRGLVDGYGDHGWFYEGTFCGRFTANIAATSYIQALRVAEGKDYVGPRSEARWLISRWLYEAVRSEGKVVYFPRGMYDRIDEWDQFNGDFAMGFGIMPDEHRGPALWFCRNVLNPDSKWGLDATGIRELVYAYVNWPVDLKPVHPAKVFPKTLWDRESGFFVFRSGWSAEGPGDLAVSMYSETMVLGRGLQKSFPMALPVGANVEVTHFREADGVTVVSARRTEGGEFSDYHFAADFTGTCGADALLVGLQPDSGVKTPEEAMAEMSPEKRKQAEALLRSLRGGSKDAKPDPTEPPTDTWTASTTTLRFMGRSLQVMTVQKGARPKVEVSGEGEKARVVIGSRRIRFDGQKMVLTSEGD